MNPGCVSTKALIRAAHCEYSSSCSSVRVDVKMTATYGTRDWGTESVYLSNKIKFGIAERVLSNALLSTSAICHSVVRDQTEPCLNTTTVYGDMGFAF